MTTNGKPEPLTAQQTADMLRLSVGFVTSHLLQPGLIPATKNGLGRWRVNRADVEAYLEKVANQPPPDKRPKVVRRRFVEGAIDERPNYLTLEENRAKLAKRIAEAKTALLIDMHGNRWIVKRATE